MARISESAPRFTGWPVIPAAFAILLVASVLPAAAAVTCEIVPSRVDIGLTYHGTTLTVTGESGAGEDVVVRIASPFEETHLKYKDKAAGLFWMKKGTITFMGTPNVFQLFSTGALSEILDPEERSRYLLDYQALASRAEMTSEEMEVDAKIWFPEFVRFKEKERLYSVREGSVDRTAGGEYRLEVDWPFQAPPGEYTVEAFAVSKGRVVGQSSCILTVARGGVGAWISTLAFDYAPIYGIVAIVIAMISGFAVGAIFKGGGGGH